VEAGVPFFFKQHGEWLHESQFASLPRNTDGRAEYFQSICGTLPPMFVSHGIHDAWYQVGKKRAGRLLDGIEWSQYPQ